MYTAVSLFSGIGGIEHGLAKHGFHTRLFCEIDPLARAVLKKNFKKTRFKSDISDLTELPRCDIVTAGFPCQDLSQAGAKQGIGGAKSGLVRKLFELVRQVPENRRPEWVLIENVPYMLRLNRGQAMSSLTRSLAGLGYRWAYRVVDARCFGLPQRRPRVVLLAARTSDPVNVLFDDNFEKPDLDGKPFDIDKKSSYGFYWTEGSRGVGWVREGVPPIKCGSTLGIASPPAVWDPRRDFVGTIDIVDAERLQGFDPGWTDFSDEGVKGKPSFRWRLVGNAVSCRLSSWVGSRLVAPGVGKRDGVPIVPNEPWPDAAWGQGKEAWAVELSRWASNATQERLSEFLSEPLKPLSSRATDGFLRRAQVCTNVVYSPNFIRSLGRHSARQPTQAT